MLREGLEKAEADEQAACLALAAARTRLRAVLELIGAETIEQAREQLALSADRVRFEGMRDAADARLREDGDGLPLDVLLASVAGIPAEAYSGLFDAANTSRKAATEAAQHATEEAAGLRQTMERQEKETGAIAAAADQQAALASLSGTLDEALVYHTAALLLGRALDAVEKSGDLSMIRRLGEIFEQLTCGAHTRGHDRYGRRWTGGFRFHPARFPRGTAKHRSIVGGHAGSVLSRAAGRGHRKSFDHGGAIAVYWRRYFANIRQRSGARGVAGVGGP